MSKKVKKTEEESELTMKNEAEITSEQQDSELSPLEARVMELEEENEKLRQELSDEKETYIRKVADMDNYRKRLVREKEASVQYANERIMLDLITILDDFERAIDAAEHSPEAASHADGVKLIYKQLLDTLSKSWGLKPMNNIVGHEFSPHDHEAMMMEEGPQYNSETVVAELQKGYYLHDRVLRTAKVKVGKPQ